MKAPQGPVSRLIVGTVIIDQITKLFALSFLKDSIVLNYGLPFGFRAPSGASVAVSIVVMIALVFIFVANRADLSRNQVIGFGLIFGGAIANLLEKVFRGYVIDFIHLSRGYMNVADLAIWLGGIIIFVSIVRPFFDQK